MSEGDKLTEPTTPADPADRLSTARTEAHITETAARVRTTASLESITRSVARATVVMAALAASVEAINAKLVPTEPTVVDTLTVPVDTCCVLDTDPQTPHLVVALAIWSTGDATPVLFHQTGCAAADPEVSWRLVNPADQTDGQASTASDVLFTPLKSFSPLTGADQ